MSSLKNFGITVLALGAVVAFNSNAFAAVADYEATVQALNGSSGIGLVQAIMQSHQSMAALNGVVSASSLNLSGQAEATAILHDLQNAARTGNPLFKSHFGTIFSSQVLTQAHVGISAGTQVHATSSSIGAADFTQFATVSETAAVKCKGQVIGYVATFDGNAANALRSVPADRIGQGACMTDTTTGEPCFMNITTDTEAVWAAPLVTTASFTNEATIRSVGADAFATARNITDANRIEEAAQSIGVLGQKCNLYGVPFSNIFQPNAQWSLTGVDVATN
jgi:hypothetical protein